MSRALKCNFNMKNKKSRPEYKHTPVMTKEIISFLNLKPGGIYVDCTLGGAGHSKAILKRIMPEGRLIGIDRDKAAILNAKKALKVYKNNIDLFHTEFSKLPDALNYLGIEKVDGILADLGVSLYQIEASGRGFSFMRDEPLDMRMNPEEGENAEDLINGLSGRNLVKIFREYGEERRAKRIANEIIRARTKKRIRTSKDLADIILKVIPGRRTGKKSHKGKTKNIHPATRVFMALRIAVNHELDNIKALMKFAPGLLKPGGRLCVLSFHSLEDRIVKHGIKTHEKECVCPPALPRCVCNHKKSLRTLTPKPVCPAQEEINENPMARSAKLRAAERV